jgi:NADPH:quinone reductase-like Zn-dependent oxidoreductase
MKAVLLQNRGADGVEIREVSDPKPIFGQALVELEASSVNRVDIYMRDSGAGITHTLPQIMGVDGVGRVREIKGESSLKIGQRVAIYPYQFCGSCEFCLSGEQPLCRRAKLLGEHIDGTFAEYICMPLQSLIPLPEDIDPAEAACLGVAYLTAWRMVFGKAKAMAGKTALIVGAGGGVALASLQLCKVAGCKVIATTNGAAKMDKLKKLGADAVINYRKEDVVERVKELTGLNGVDFAVDNVGESSWSSTLKCVKRGGDIITCGATTGGHPSAELQRLFIRQLSVHGSTMGNLYEFSNVLKTFKEGLFSPIIDSKFSLQDAKLAIDRMDAVDRFGKVVLIN